MNSQRRSYVVVGACAAIALALSCQTLWAVTAANASFTNPADLDFFEYHFPTVKKDAANPTYNFNVYNLPTSGSTSTMSLVQVESLPTTPPITLQSGTVSGLAAVGPGGTPKAPMQLTLSTSQGGNLYVQFTLEFVSDSVTAPHQLLSIAAYAIVLPPGDYDSDGDVDMTDYAIWRSHFGSNYAAADGNQNGVVDAADYVVWRKNYTGALGTGGSMTLDSNLSTSLAVPEPTAAILELLAAACAALFTSVRTCRGRCACTVAVK